MITLRSPASVVDSLEEIVDSTNNEQTRITVQQRGNTEFEICESHMLLPPKPV